MCWLKVGEPVVGCETSALIAANGGIWESPYVSPQTRTFVFLDYGHSFSLTTGDPRRF